MKTAAEPAAYTCTDADHEVLRADPNRFRAATLPGWTQDDGYEFMEFGHCRACHSTIALCGPSRRAA